MISRVRFLAVSLWERNSIPRDRSSGAIRRKRLPTCEAVAGYQRARRSASLHTSPRRPAARLPCRQSRRHESGAGEHGFDRRQQRRCLGRRRDCIAAVFLIVAQEFAGLPSEARRARLGPGREIRHSRPAVELGVGRCRSPAATAWSNAPRIFGRAASNAAQNSRSSRRWLSWIGGRVIDSARSARSGRVREIADAVEHDGSLRGEDRFVAVGMKLSCRKAAAGGQPTKCIRQPRPARSTDCRTPTARNCRR